MYYIIPMISIRAPVKMMASTDGGIQKRAQKDLKKLKKVFTLVQTEGDQRRADVDKQLREISEGIDKIAKKDVKKLQEIFVDTYVDDIDDTLDLDDDDFETFGDAITFKSKK